MLSASLNKIFLSLPLPQLQVVQQDGRPVAHSSKTLSIKTRVTWEEKAPAPTPKYYYPKQHNYNLPETHVAVPNTGMVPIEVHIPSNATSINIYVSTTYECGAFAHGAVGRRIKPTELFLVPASGPRLV